MPSAPAEREEAVQKAIVEAADDSALAEEIEYDEVLRAFQDYVSGAFEQQDPISAHTLSEKFPFFVRVVSRLQEQEALDEEDAGELISEYIALMVDLSIRDQLSESLNIALDPEALGVPQKRFSTTAVSLLSSVTKHTSSS